MPQDLQLLPRPRRVTALSDHPVSPSPRVERIDPGTVPQTQGYRLTVASDRIELIGHDEAGLFYGKQTLKQLERLGELPAVEIEDWPDYPVRGVMLDVSRTRVPSMGTLRELIDQFASWKINHLQLYTEHTFAYVGHEVVWRDASPLTPDEVRELDAYCRARHIELVPNQNSFGHMARWLVHEPYAELAECPDGFEHPISGPVPYPFTLTPSDPQVLTLLDDLYDQLLPNFTSRLFNIGCDETFDLGQGRSKAECEAHGVGRVYLDFLLQLHERVCARGKTMLYWGDIVVQHPELIGELPGDAVALHWGYEAAEPSEESCAAFGDSGVAYWVCPGTSSWCSFAGRTDNAAANLHAAAQRGLRHGATGYLITDWGDMGHIQPYTVSTVMFAYGAAVAWHTEGHPQVDELAGAIDIQVFEGSPVTTAALQLGRVYTHAGPSLPNRSGLFELWLRPEAPMSDERLSPITESTVTRCSEEIEAAVRSLPSDGVAADELRWTAALLHHLVEQARARLDHSGVPVQEMPAETRDRLTSELNALRERYRALWLARSRLGGLDESCEWFDRVLAYYAGREAPRKWY